MTSGEFGSIAISDVHVKHDRVRKEIKDETISALADSISRLGLIHPITIDRENTLCSGETRLRACTLLGWDSISFQYIDTLDADALLAIELEENIKRVDLPWQDQVDALRRFHELKKRTEPAWTQDATADALGISKSTVIAQLAVAKELASGNERVKAAKEYSTARGIVVRSNERKASDDMALLSTFEELPKIEVPILNLNFIEWVETYAGAPFNLIHCDFPYGINADKFNQGAANSFGGYADTFETYEKLLDCLISNREKLMGESGHIIFWFSMQHYTYTLQRLQEHFWVDSYPLVWHKSDNKGTLPDPARGPRRVYEVAFLCSHGDRKILSSVSNTFSGPTTRVSEHMSEKSVDMLKHFMRMVIDGNARVLDPTCGGGSAIRAADALGAGYVLGLERDPEFAANAERAWKAYKG